MSAFTDNDHPVAPEGTNVTETGIVPASGIRVPDSTLVWVGYLWCILAGAASPSTAMLSSLCAGYGTLMLTVLRGTRETAIGVGIACVSAVVAGLIMGVDLIPSSLITLLAASVVGAGLGSGRLTSGGICLVCVLTALALLGTDSTLATLAGMNLYDLVIEQIDKTFAALQEGVTGLDEGFAMARDIMLVLWPTSYTVTAAAGVIAAALGGRIARNGLGSRAPRTLTLTTFDPPLWVAGVLLFSIVGLAASQVAPAGNVVLAVAANLMMAVRFAFGMDGIAVVAWRLRTRGTGMIVTSLVCAILVFIDMQFFVMAIVGLIDFWANFRHLPRGMAQIEETV